MGCPKCGAALKPLKIQRTSLEQCQGCQGLWLSRATLLELREASPSAHPVLAATPEPDGDAAPGDPEGLSCARCGQHMSSFYYRGGKTKVESCKRCDQLFLDSGELGRILKEWRHGLEMSDDKRAFLRTYREQAAWRRMFDSKLELGGIALGAVALFLVLAVGWEDCAWSGYRRYSLPLPLAVAVTAGWYLLRRRRLKEEQRSARKVIRKLGREAKGSSSSGLEPRRPAQRREATGKKQVKKTTARCPWCNAPIAADTSRCKACDSDVF